MLRFKDCKCFLLPDRCQEAALPFSFLRYAGADILAPAASMNTLRTMAVREDGDAAFRRQVYFMAHSGARGTIYMLHAISKRLRLIMAARLAEHFGGDDFGGAREGMGERFSFRDGQDFRQAARHTFALGCLLSISFQGHLARYSPFGARAIIRAAIRPFLLSSISHLSARAARRMPQQTRNTLILIEPLHDDACLCHFCSLHNFTPKTKPPGFLILTPYTIHADAQRAPTPCLLASTSFIFIATTPPTLPRRRRLYAASSSPLFFVVGKSSTSTPILTHRRRPFCSSPLRRPPGNNIRPCNAHLPCSCRSSPSFTIAHRSSNGRLPALTVDLTIMRVLLPCCRGRDHQRVRRLT